MSNENCCKCWLNPNPVIKAITGHHESCRKSKKIDVALVELISDLLVIDSLSEDKAQDTRHKAKLVIEAYAKK